MIKIDWDNIKTRLDALVVIDEYRTDPNKEWLRLVVKIEETMETVTLLIMVLGILWM